MIILNYPSKKVLREQIGQPLRCIETSMFGPEYLENGTFFGANRPSVTGHGRFVCAKVTWISRITMRFWRLHRRMEVFAVQTSTRTGW